MTSVTVSAIGDFRARDFEALGVRWRDLERRADLSFFQSWTWTGCLAEERFSDPVLVEARDGGRTVAFALFNRRGRTLYLGESGDPERDSIYVEFNGVLAERGRERELIRLCLAAARGGPVWGSLSRYRLILSGVSRTVFSTVNEIGHAHVRQSLKAPYVDLKNIKEDFLGGLSANTRQQLRRSERAYGTRGPLRLERAETVATAHVYLEALRVLHQASWTARGQPGAFAAPFFGRFHHALVERGLPRGEIDLFRVSSGEQAIGFLYNFRHRGVSLAYQGGFDYAAAGRHEKPGLTCHQMALCHARRDGAEKYDFLAGDDRYKRSLSNGEETLYWLEIEGFFSPRVLARRGRALLRRLRRDPAGVPVGDEE